LRKAQKRELTGGSEGNTSQGGSFWSVLTGAGRGKKGKRRGVKSGRDVPSKESGEKILTKDSEVHWVCQKRVPPKSFHREAAKTLLLLPYRRKEGEKGMGEEI